MFGKIADTFKVPELKRRILFTLAMIVIYRLGVHIPTPGINLAKMGQLFGKQEGLLGFLDMFSGGALRNFSNCLLDIFLIGIRLYNHVSNPFSCISIKKNCFAESNIFGKFALKPFISILKLIFFGPLISNIFC